MKKLILRNIAMAIILILKSPVVFSAGERVVINFLPYSSEKPSDFNQFKSQLDSSKTDLIQDVISKTKAGYLKSLSIRPIKTDNPEYQLSSINDFEQYWKTNTNTLEILTGYIATRPDGTYLVSSQIYLGELQQQLPHNIIQLDIPFSVNNYAIAIDTHAAFLFYNLAMDSKRVNPNDSILFSNLMKVSNDKITDLKKNSELKKDSKLYQSIIELEKVITIETKAMKVKQK
jgi:hypothetical protein